MTLGQALALSNRSGKSSSRHKALLACGFQALHLATFLKAHFAVRFPLQGLDIETGVYNDLHGTLVSAAAGSDAQETIIVIEWADLDPRLGIRGAGAYGPSAHRDMLATCEERLSRLLTALQALAARMPVAVAGPTVPPVPFGQTGGWQFSVEEAEFARLTTRFFAEAVRLPNVSVAHPARLASVSPEGTRSDTKMELVAGFPYTVAHASALAECLVKTLFPPPPMKGLITDLDDTLWAGLVGEVGPAAVSWSLAEHSQLHAQYQQQLRKLAEMGVLLAIASKNDLPVAESALRRHDLHVKADSFFPVLVSWNAKSSAVAEILRIWNIGPESVVFVDDSPMELDEVRTAFPAITCLHFQKNDPAKAFELFEQLRDLFGKPVIQKEDTFRLASIRANAELQEAAGKSAPAEYLQQLGGKVLIDAGKEASNKRLLELVNKTNQFNLNGVRVTESEWMRLLADEATMVLGVSYTDKFGPLGTIAVLVGKREGRHIDVSSWVLSCRAFSRAIELHTLDYLFRSTDAQMIAFEFVPTERNGPLQSFLQTLGLPVGKAARLTLSRDDFFAAPHRVLPHEVELAEVIMKQQA